MCTQGCSQSEAAGMGKTNPLTEPASGVCGAARLDANIDLQLLF